MLSPIQAYLRKAASRDRIHQQVGPFLATVSRDTDNPYLNYAIPDDGADPTPRAVQTLIEFYQAHNRIPRLEYSSELAPAVEAALVREGFGVEQLTPLMVYPSGKRPELLSPDGIEILAPHSDDELSGMMIAQSEAYGGTTDQPAPEAVEKQHAFVAAGGIAVFARETGTGEPAGGGVCDVPFDHTTELAGIGVRPRFRRRGIAGAMTAWLVQKALEVGTWHIFLMAADEPVARIYARVGFEPIGNIQHISRR